MPSIPTANPTHAIARRPISLVGVLLMAALLLSAVAAGTVKATEPQSCAATPPDALGPFYQPDAPLRHRVGQGYLLKGQVKSTKDCAPIAAARIELWLAGPQGRYLDRYRATIFSDASGAFWFESHFPPAYFGRPPHIHIKISAEGYRTLTTQHYPQAGQHQGDFDLVLTPVR